MLKTLNLLCHLSALSSNILRTTYWGRFPLGLEAATLYHQLCLTTWKYHQINKVTLFTVLIQELQFYPISKIPTSVILSDIPYYFDFVYDFLCFFFNLKKCCKNSSNVTACWNIVSVLDLTKTNIEDIMCRPLFQSEAAKPRELIWDWRGYQRSLGLGTKKGRYIIELWFRNCACPSVVEYIQVITQMWSPSVSVFV